LGLKQRGEAERSPDQELPERPPGRARATWTWFEAVAVFVVGNVVLGQVLVASVVLALLGVREIDEGPADVPTLLATLAADAVFAGAMLLWLGKLHPRWRGAIGVPERTRLGHEIRYGVVSGIVLYPVVAFGVGAVLTLLFRAFWGDDVSTPEQLETALGPAGWILAAVVAFVAAPFTEELFFRGILYRSIRDRHGFWPAAVASSVVFGLVHYVPSPWPDALLLQSVLMATGFGLAWIYERRGNLVANTVAHATFNVIGLVLIATVR
jgi:hypothetical protein